METGNAELEKLAAADDSAAQLALAEHFAADGKNQLARNWFARAASSGNVPALRLLGINLLTQQPIVGGDGVAMLRRADEAGDADAAHLCAMLAVQDFGLNQRWRIALECSTRAAERGSALARGELDLLAKSGGSLEALTKPASIRMMFEAPCIGVLENFASAEICDWLVARARPRLSGALVYDSVQGGSRPDQDRSNSAVPFDLVQSDLILMTLRARIAATAGLVMYRLEPASVLHYAPGQRFEPHFDFLDRAVPAYARDVAANGQRAVTFLLYLNDDFEGGETDFPKLDWRYKGRKGDALIFWNIQPSGMPDRQTFHAGLPPTKGEKWLLSQWIRIPPR